MKTVDPLEGVQALFDLLRRELRGEASEQEYASLRQDEASLRQWEAGLRALESQALEEVKEQHQIMDVQRSAIQAIEDQDERDATMRSWHREQEGWRVSKVLQTNKFIARVRDRRKQVLLAITAAVSQARQTAEAEREARREEARTNYEKNAARREEALTNHLRQSAPSYATAYRRGFRQGLGYLYGLIRSGVPAREAYDLCMEYLSIDLLAWRDAFEYEAGTPPPPFPHVHAITDEYEQSGTRP